MVAQMRASILQAGKAGNQNLCEERSSEMCGFAAPRA
jgi:hypothetical protein